MAMGIDSVANSGAVTPPANSIPVGRQAPIHPGTDRARSNDRQQKDQAKNGASFQAELTAVETAAEKFVADVNARRTERKSSSTDKPLRAEKRPQDSPVELDAEEGAKLFAEAQSVSARVTATTPQRRETDAGYRGHIPASNEFMVAASRYAERVFAQAGNGVSKPGESLEITA